ncbi:copper resistance protein A -like protein [Mycolicibacterium fortuitum subsp. acetamidolyticum]|uniref:Copper resistance protein A-like protein n=1 Tax=Mycolicibacterium fortuitum subsp. acetamidolyticum TaxID=144550 RepID=A0A100WLA2_MYCFO|nr:copper resistance protein A -like protein [Mycolicibacterium fortuitum subsp. acetamidolyticum]
MTAALKPAPATIDLGGPTPRTLAYSDTVPAAPIRASVGDEFAVTVTNGLDHATSVNWHGIALRNDMDGAAPGTPTSTPARSSPTDSRCRIRAPIGPTRTPPWTPILGCIYR